MPKRRLKSTWFNKCIWEAFRIHSWFNISVERENESLYILTVVVFYVFGMMFIKMNKKYTKRIMGYEEIRPFWYFFDLKAYMIMACMMGGGIGFRAMGIFSDIFIVFFYSGLGFALALAGITFLRNHIQYENLLLD
mgnify:FL=1